mmetsp:Transcript_25090/g.59219  ORF Transcript_25090/g.59219 Transcript_25090/m.59219 type:complete len:104 (-) Transcript_25090:107-418(-)|eukprot:CAMPEP_0172401574 /NCGR_PEP_ID=MMETSP1061-20121228/50856_1 /TAXON_ID=37318 /ORGANISM="Pseudo-nitzschia pungens, Strain cf. pungens" /LENGTH=103 /DNA_ID=CAMNT_0013135257 /DNA_START=467 /DNA_END=778 /DNA_ORIENTATION=-
MSEFWAVGGELVDAVVPPAESWLFVSLVKLFPAGPPGPLNGDEGKPPPEESMSSIAANGSTSAADASAGDASFKAAVEDTREKSCTTERLDSMVVAVSTASKR